MVPKQNLIYHLVHDTNFLGNDNRNQPSEIVN